MQKLLSLSAVLALTVSMTGCCHCWPWLCGNPYGGYGAGYGGASCPGGNCGPVVPGGTTYPGATYGPTGSVYGAYDIQTGAVISPAPPMVYAPGAPITYAPAHPVAYGPLESLPTY